MGNSDTWGIKFAEHMGGSFCQGVSDPGEGFRRGKTEGHPVDFWVRIHMDPLKEFMKNPDKTAALSGQVSAGPLGQKLEIKNGAFNMFSGEQGSGLRHITYRFGFIGLDSNPYFFSGVKNIHSSKQERTRREPVTLYSSIYKGDSEDGELMGSGILLFDMLKDGPGLFSSIRVTGAQSIGERLKALRMFVTSSA